MAYDCSFFDSLKRFGGALWSALVPDGPARLPSLHRLLILLVLVPGFVVLQGVHWIGFLLDEIFFPAHRSVTLRKPVFVLGVPRSGTTFLHKVLACDERYTTFSVWECLFAPSIIERKVFMALGRIDASLGAPLARLVNWLAARIFSGLDDIHEMGLGEPEEDYLALLPLFASFIMIVPFPEAKTLWQVGAIDKEMEEGEKARLLLFYQRLLQKHLYVHGREKVLLSKNAAFAGMAGSLKDTFPDARFFVCVRDPLEVVPSQLSSLEGGFKLCGSLPEPQAFNEKMVSLLHGHYQNLITEFEGVSSLHHRYTPQRTLKEDLAVTIKSVYEEWGMDLSVEFEESLSHQSGLSREHSSKHAYDLADYGMDERVLKARFADIYERLPVQVTSEKPSDSTSGSGKVDPSPNVENFNQGVS